MAAKRILSISLVADSEDLAQANNYLVIDTPSGTKKVPANLLVSSAALNALLPGNVSASNPLVALSSLAEEWDPSQAYGTLALATHGDKLYMCSEVESTQGTWVDDEWVETSMFAWIAQVMLTTVFPMMEQLESLDQRVTALEQR